MKVSDERKCPIPKSLCLIVSLHAVAALKSYDKSLLAFFLFFYRDFYIVSAHVCRELRFSQHSRQICCEGRLNQRTDRCTCNRSRIFIVPLRPIIQTLRPACRLSLFALNRLTGLLDVFWWDRWGSGIFAFFFFFFLHFGMIPLELLWSSENYLTKNQMLQNTLRASSFPFSLFLILTIRPPFSLRFAVFCPSLFHIGAALS